MITTNDPDIAERIRVLRSHGGVRVDGRFTFVDAGYNYRMSDVQGALGIAQMRRLDSIIDARRSHAAALTAQLDTVTGLVPPPSDEPGQTYQSYVARVDESIDRDYVIRRLSELGVESTIGTYGLHLEPYFRDAYGLRPEDLPNSTTAAAQTLTLPLYRSMKPVDITRIERAVRLALNEWTTQ